MPFDTGEMAGRVEAMLRQMQRVEPSTADDLLTNLLATAMEGLPAARHVGITVANRAGNVKTLASSGRVADLLDEIQELHQEGPCLSAAWTNHLVTVRDLATETRWPAYAKDAVEQTPVRAVLAFQLFADNQTMGALNFYAETADSFDDVDVETGLALATHTVLAWSLIRRDDQFRSALASRDLIGQAKGMLMERFGIDAVQAFELLRRLSQESNTQLVDVAGRITTQSAGATTSRNSSGSSRR